MCQRGLFSAALGQHFQKNVGILRTTCDLIPSLRVRSAAWAARSGPISHILVVTLPYDKRIDRLIGRLNEVPLVPSYDDRGGSRNESRATTVGLERQREGWKARCLTHLTLGTTNELKSKGKKKKIMEWIGSWSERPRESTLSHISEKISIWLEAYRKRDSRKKRW